MGDDFRYLNAERYFKFIDRLIRWLIDWLIEKKKNFFFLCFFIMFFVFSYFNKHSNYKLKIFYSTPSLYIKDLHSSQISWPLKFGDFFPYASEINVYWTGYFTSKPTLKYFERLSNNFLQVFIYNLFTCLTLTYFMLFFRRRA